MNTHDAVQFLDTQTREARSGLPEDVFLFVSRVTPMVNVDLLIRDEGGRFLLSWRDDVYAGRGWHLPGGIVRFKERMGDRVAKVAQRELGVAVEVDPVPAAINEIICSHETRGHFISVLFTCFLSGAYTPRNHNLSPQQRGFVEWHDVCPDDLIESHQMYRTFMGSPPEHT